MQHMTSKLVTASVAMTLAFFVTPLAHAEQSGTSAPKPSMQMKQDLDIPGREGAVSFVEFPPGSAEVNHTHPADLFVFVREGEVSVESEGKPTTSYKVGDVFFVGSGKMHRVSNQGTVTARTVAFFVAEKGKPLTAPVPAK